MSLHILAVEDSATQAAALVAYLESAGYSVTHVSDGSRAIEIFDPAVHDLVITDIVMPDMNGYGVCRHIKSAHPHVPVILLTAMTDPLDVVQALTAGADNFLRKPYNPDDLLHRVRNMLHNKQMRDRGRAQMGLELYFLGQRFLITSDRQQILDLLVSTFEELVTVNQRLRSREAELAQAHVALSRGVVAEAGAA